MKKEELGNYLITKEFKFEGIEVELRELNTREFFKLQKIQVSEDNLQIMDYFYDILESLIVKHNVEGATNKEVSDVICNKITFFTELIEKYSDFLTKHQQKKK